MFLQYLLGLRELGWDVLLLDRLEPDMCVDDAAAARAPLEHSANVALPRGGDGAASASATRWALLLDGGRALRSGCRPRRSCWSGWRRRAAAERERLLDDAEVLDRARLRVFLDIDPGFGQMWRELGLHDPFARPRRLS